MGAYWLFKGYNPNAARTHARAFLCDLLTDRPTTFMVNGDTAIVLEDGHEYLWVAGAWADQGAVISGGGGGGGPEYDNGNSGAAITIDLANGTQQLLTLTDDAVITFDATGAAAGTIYLVRMVQAGNDGWYPTYAGIDDGRWLSATTAPDPNTDDLGETLLILYYDGVHLLQSSNKVGTT